MRNSTHQWTLEETLIADLERLLCLEKAFMMTLPMMAQSASNPSVQQEFERLMGQTREQIARLQPLLPSDSAALQTPIKDEDPRPGTAGGSLLDCMLIAEVRQKQHAKIALYSTTCLWANQLGLQKMETSLSQNLKEEEEDCEQLLQLAQRVGCAIS